MTTERLWRAPADALPAAADFAVTTRRGGVSEGAFASLNVGLVDGERADRVAENRRRVLEEFGIAEPEPLRLHQVHGTRVVAAQSEDARRGARADGFVLGGAGAGVAAPCVAVSIADCAPVAIVTGDGAAAALLHSGWRGTLDGIVARAVSLLAGDGADPARLRAVIGPCIHPCCYPVGPEVARRFPSIHLRAHPSGRPALDLPGAIAAALVAAGVPGARLFTAPECTSCRGDLFYSHRRDRGVTGRHWALLRLRGAPRPGG